MSRRSLALRSQYNQRQEFLRRIQRELGSDPAPPEWRLRSLTERQARTIRDLTALRSLIQEEVLNEQSDV